MKRLTIFTTIATLFFLAIIPIRVMAQPRAVGAYTSIYSTGAYYQHSINDTDYLEAQLGLDSCTIIGYGLGFDAGINYATIFSSSRKNKGTLEWWIGAGLHGSYGITALIPKMRRRNPFVGLAINLGVDFKFDTNVQIYAKLSPKFGYTWGPIGRGGDYLGEATQFDIGKPLCGIMFPEIGIAHAF